MTDLVKDPKWANHEDEDEMPESEDIQDLDLEEYEEMEERSLEQYEQDRYQSASNDWSVIR